MKKKWWQLPLKFNPSPYSPPTPPLSIEDSIPFFFLITACLINLKYVCMYNRPTF